MYYLLVRILTPKSPFFHFFVRSSHWSLALSTCIPMCMPRSMRFSNSDQLSLVLSTSWHNFTFNYSCCLSLPDIPFYWSLPQSSVRTVLVAFVFIGTFSLLHIPGSANCDFFWLLFRWSPVPLLSLSHFGNYFLHSATILLSLPSYSPLSFASRFVGTWPCP